jgi:hypothetical protein
VYVTLYVFKVLAERSITPVFGSSDNPLGVAVNDPPAVPVITGDGSIPLWQKVAEE